MPKDINNIERDEFGWAGFPKLEQFKCAQVLAAYLIDYNPEKS